MPWNWGGQFRCVHFQLALSNSGKQYRRMKIAIGSDHAGFEYKGRIIEMLAAAGHEVRDFGTHSTAPVDYPLFIAPAAQAVASGECERGVVLGGSGNGEQITANKVRGIRCA